MSISNLRPASAFEVAWRGVSPDDLEGEAAARVAADAALQAQIDAEEAARIAADNNEAAIRAAADAAMLADIEANDLLARSELLTEPAVSELASMWSTTLTGEPKSRAGLAESAFAFDGVDGLVLQVTGAGSRAPRAAYRMIPGHKYEVLAAARRSTDPSDPPASSVRLRAEWLSAAKAHVAIAQLDTDPLPVSTGLRLYRKVVSTVAGSEVDVVAAAGTVYFTPLMQAFGTDGTTNILPYIRVTDLTSNTLISADISALDARLTALESQNLNARLTTLEGLSTGSDIARFETRAKAVSAAAAGSILTGVDVLEVLGIADGGDDVVKPYSRELADPGTGDRFHDAGGSWWVARAQGLQQVNGLAELRTIIPAASRVVRLNYHTTIGDLGAGDFRGVTGAAAGTYVDNTGTIIVPTGGDGSTAWLRIWNGVTAHVGWFGAKCDNVTDDYTAAKKCLDIFTNGRTGLRTGAIDVGPGFAFSQPLIYGGVGTYGFRLFGHHSLARGAEQISTLKYTGPAAPGAIILYGANETTLEAINVTPGLAYNGVLVTTDNQYNQTLTSPVTAGTDVVATVGSTSALQPGAFLGVDAGGANFEIVTVSVVNSSTQFTATFAKNHVSGVQVGGGSSASGLHFNRCRLLCPQAVPLTTLTAATSGSGVKTLSVADVTGIKVGMPIRVDSYGISEIVYPTSVGPGSFDATVLNSHPNTGVPVMYPTAAILFGNRLTQTVQISEISFQGTNLVGYNTTSSYAGIRMIQGGNTKNITAHNIGYNNLKVVFAGEGSSGQLLFSGMVGAAISDTLFLAAGGTLTVIALEDELSAMLLRGGAGSNLSNATFVGITMQGNAPTTDDEMAIYAGQLTFLGCMIKNGRVTNTSIPKIVVNTVRSATSPGGLALINCNIWNVDANGLAAGVAGTGFVRDVPAIFGGGVDLIADGTGKLTMLGCIGGFSGSPVRLPDILPSKSRWEGTATYDPPDLVPGTVDTAQTMTVTGAVLGDLVEASFSNDLQGGTLRAWVSAANTVKFQFAYPLGSLPNPLVLASGTVKCRVKK